MTEEQLNNQLLCISKTVASILPSQKGNANKVLTTNGTTLSWSAAGGNGNGNGNSPIDANPTAGSVNAVQSGGVAIALASKVDKVTGKQLSTNDFTTVEKTKLATVATGATANASDSALRDRSTHSGTQLASTISNFTTAVIASLTPGSNITISPEGVISSQGGGSGAAESTIISGSPNAVAGGAVFTALASKVNTVSGKQLSTEDFTTAEKTKLTSISNGATANSPDSVLLNRGNHTGTQTADTITDGVTNKTYTAAEKSKLAGISAGATTNSSDASLLARANHTGTQLASTISDFSTAADARVIALKNVANGVAGLDATGNLSADKIVDGATNKAYSATDKTKLAGIATGATLNSTDAILLNRANHTGTQNADTIVDGTTNKVYTNTEKLKLAGVSIGATTNSTDAQLRDRTTHTGVQAISTISGLQTSLDSKALSTDVTTAVTTLKGGVVPEGDTLAKVYAVALGSVSEVTVANIAARNAYNVVSLPKQVFVLDDGDGNWATYKATSTGVGATYVKINDYDTVNGVMSASSIKTAYESNSDTNAYTNAEKTKLTNIATGATLNSADSFLLSRANHTGTQSADSIIDGSTNKAYTSTEKTKLASIASGATVNSTDAVLLARANHTGTQSADTLTDGTTNKAFLATERTKLAGITSGATVNSTDATLLARANHTGTQLSATISDLTTSIDSRITVVKGAANGILGLDSTSKFSADFAVDGTTNKVYTATEKTKLAGITAGATVNSADSVLLARSNHTGFQTASTISDFSSATDTRIGLQKNAANGILGLDASTKVSSDFLIDGTTNKAYTATEKTKLAGISSAATANSTDATLLNRANHTGTQLASTISNFNAAALTAAPAETTITVGTLINGALGKTTLVDADVWSISDSAASSILKKVSWVDLKTNIKAYYDGVTSTFTGKSISGSTNTLSNIPIAAIVPADTTIFDPATKQNLVSLTTIGTSGAATFNQSTGALNIPNYATGGGGGGTISAAGDLPTQLSALGAPYKFLSFGVPYFPYPHVGTQMFLSGDQIFCAMYLPAGAVITGLKFMLQASGVYTAATENFNGTILYSFSGGILTKVAQSANTPNFWTAAEGVPIASPFTASYTVPNSGIYYASAQYWASAETQTPALVAMDYGEWNQLNNPGFANNAFITGKGGYSAAPLTTANATTDINKYDISNPIWVAAY